MNKVSFSIILHKSGKKGFFYDYPYYYCCCCDDGDCCNWFGHCFICRVVEKVAVCNRPTDDEQFTWRLPWPRQYSLHYSIRQLRRILDAKCFPHIIFCFLLLRCIQCVYIRRWFMANTNYGQHIFQLILVFLHCYATLPAVWQLLQVSAFYCHIIESFNRQ